jgi:superfamily II DNA or RNA helicase
VRSEAHAVVEVVQRATRTLGEARGAAGEALARRAEQVARRRLAEMPVDRLRDLISESGVRLAALEAGGVRTVADVLDRSPAELDALPGVGTTTSTHVHAAARQLAERVQAQVRPLPEPDTPAPGDAELLASLHRLVVESRARPGLEAPAVALEARLAPDLETLDRIPTALGWLVTRRTKKSALTAAGRRLQGALAEPATQDVVARLRRAEQETVDYRAPAGDELWHDLERRGADYAAVLDGLGAPGVAAAPGPGLRGGVAAAIADRVEQIPLDVRGLNVTLRGYQHFGVQYLVGQRRSILGDEMGLGKTIQALAAMCHLRATEQATHFFVVAPASILSNWMREIVERTDLPAHLLHGEEREEATWRWAAEGGVAVTSFTTLSVLPLGDTLTVRPPAFVVVDEAHYVKNPSAARTRAVAALLDRSTGAVLMSGTPMENRVEEFRALVDVLQPPDRSAVDAAELLLVEGQPDAFRERLSPIYLRRNQEDVLTELPERLDIEEWIELEGADADAYRSAVAAGEVMAMRQAATLGAAHRPPGAAPAVLSDTMAPPGEFGDPEADTAPGKLERLLELFEEYRVEGRKVLVFSFFRGVIDAVARLAGGCPQITGDVPPAERLALIDAFTATPGFAVLAAQIEAGGVGVNVQAASVVVLMEPQWKPSTENQAIARAHRMGQVRRVVVHRLLARDSIDEWLVELVRAKQGLFDDYARPSAVKDATEAATAVGVAEAGIEQVSDAELARQAVAAEQTRLGLGA